MPPLLRVALGLLLLSGFLTLEEAKDCLPLGEEGLVVVAEVSRGRSSGMGGWLGVVDAVVVLVALVLISRKRGEERVRGCVGVPGPVGQQQRQACPASQFSSLLSGSRLFRTVDAFLGCVGNCDNVGQLSPVHQRAVSSGGRSPGDR